MEQSAESSSPNNEMGAWYKQRFLKEEKIPTIQDMIEIAESIRYDRDRALFILLYLTGCRIRELVRKKDKVTGRWRKSIIKNDIQLTERNGRKILLINLRNQKNRERKRKDIPIPLDIKENALFFNMLTDYINSLGNESELFPMSYQNAYLVVSKLGFNPHFIRHIRLTHLVTKYGFKEHQLRIYAGWTDSRPAKNYLEMVWEDLLY